MKIKHVSIVLILLILTSCYEVKKPKKPDNLISEDNMVTILMDMAIMSSAKGVNKGMLEQNSIVPDAFIYKKNNIDSITFVESNAYYAFDINKYDAIYLRVKDSLNSIRDKYKTIEAKAAKEKQLKDSLNQAKKNTTKKVKNPKIPKKEDLQPLLKK